MRRTSLALASFALLASCGGGDSAPATTVPAGVDLVVRAVPTIRWDAASYTAPAGEIDVFLANDDSVKHDLVILKGDKTVGEFELKVQKRGDTAQGTITLEPGEYRIYCVVPGHGSMDSTLTVS